MVKERMTGGQSFIIIDSTLGTLHAESFLEKLAYIPKDNLFVFNKWHNSLIEENHSMMARANSKDSQVFIHTTLDGSRGVDFKVKR
jgi:hypothetical protein